MSSKGDHRPVVVELELQVSAQESSQVQMEKCAAINVRNTSDPFLKKKLQDKLWHLVEGDYSDPDAAHLRIVIDIKKLAVNVFGTLNDAPRKPWITSSTRSTTRLIGPFRRKLAICSPFATSSWWPSSSRCGDLLLTPASQPSRTL